MLCYSVLLDGSSTSYLSPVFEIHSRTNAIGMPIQINNVTHTTSVNIKEVIDLESFQNNSRMSISYISNDWIRTITDLNDGKLLLISIVRILMI